MVTLQDRDSSFIYAACMNFAFTWRQLSIFSVSVQQNYLVSSTFVFILWTRIYGPAVASVRQFLAIKGFDLIWFSSLSNAPLLYHKNPTDYIIAYYWGATRRLQLLISGWSLSTQQLRVAADPLKTASTIMWPELELHRQYFQCMYEYSGGYIE